MPDTLLTLTIWSATVKLGITAGASTIIAEQWTLVMVAGMTAVP